MLNSTWPKKDYGARVAESLGIMLNILDILVVEVIIVVAVIFGWPFALLSWLNEKAGN